MSPKSPEDRILDHSYDGIQEYDNPLPGWWVYIFYATILFAILYGVNVPGIGTGRGRIANYEREMDQWKQRQEELAAKTPRPDVSDAGLLAIARDPARMELGRSVWMNNCSPCHRPDGGGSIGPNLTDDYWIHGGKPTDLYRVVDEGVLEKGMPVWGKTLKPDQLAAVVAYATTLQGTDPPNPKEPQGTKFEEQEEEPEGAVENHPN